MYLKSLVLKGFKSFADKSVLELQPGITAIVGPNGSGKSNISDAVLWVLGERSARNLRGQAMEDIVFSGSAARKAVSVAEVDLVLDNSDGTLPVEYDEVAITRRMYRSGESEYLINGAMVRRLDVLDILHDSGLGTGTHSIISQGSLDSILQSRPEDRRALIEEAAGVLKHKQRKEKSARKLQAMETHLMRVRDVAAEIERQLGPLERKAKRARAFEEANARLQELRLELAVDDLRTLKAQWDVLCESESQLAGEVATIRETVDASERKVADYQELIRRETADAGELAKKQRRGAQLSERFDSAEMLLRERRRGAVEYGADLQITLDSAASRHEGALHELEEAKKRFEGVASDFDAASAKVDALRKESDEAYARRRDVDRSISDTEKELKNLESDMQRDQRKLATLKESLSSGMAQEKIIETRKAELSGELERAADEHEQAKRAYQAAADKLEALVAEEREAQALTLAKFEEREDARSARDRARQDLSVLEAELKAVEKAQRASREGDPALVWLVDNVGKLAGRPSPVSKALDVPRGLELLVEQLLGESIEGMAVDDAGSARDIARLIVDEKLTGAVSLVIREAGEGRASARGATGIGTPLIEKLAFGDDARAVVESLIGDVVLCDTLDEAFEAFSKREEPCRYISADGCLLYPNGLVRVFGEKSDSAEGVLALERRLRELQERIGGQKASCEAAEVRAAQTDESYRSAQAAALKLSQELANQKGTCSALKADEQRAGQKRSSLGREFESIESQVAEARKSIEDLRPAVASLESSIEEQEKRRAESRECLEELNERVVPLRKEAAQLRESLNEAKLSSATLKERKTYAERLIVARQRDVDDVEAGTAEARRSMAVKRVAVERADGLLSVFEAIAETLHRRTRVLDEALDASQDATDTIHVRAAEAREDARRAHDAFDAANERMTQAKVEKSRLEIRVEAAVQAVVHDCGVPLDKAQELPALEDRASAEEEAGRLERRIKNMGAINPDAAQEYEALKVRYDFFSGQLADMEAARRSLNRIVRVIDSRMKDDFVKTFAEVNENFSDIFALLFPGGQAHLSLDDPDDIENTGVEVTAQPRGKRLTKMMLMSGGEKSLTALALLFAVYKTRATPFYILDEVEAALDDTNLRRLAAYINSLRDSTQLIMITHQRRTMEMADVLFGVSMQADGVTKVVSQKLERALEHAE